MVSRSALVALVLWSCGGETTGGSATTTGGTGPSPDTVSCTITQTINAGGMSFTQSFCTESSGLTPDQINAQRTSCSATIDLDGGIMQAGMFAQGPCSRANVIGGCRITSGGFSSTSWYYANAALTVDQLKTICSNIGGTFVTS
jgi:hypothetical protein